MKLQSHSVLNCGLLQETRLAALEGCAFIHFCFVGIQWKKKCCYYSYSRQREINAKGDSHVEEDM